MYKNCTTPDTVLRQRHLETVFMEMLQSTSYHNITVGAVCKQAGVPRGMFYRYFDSKDDVLDAMIDHVLMDYAAFDCNLHALREEQRALRYWRQQEGFLRTLLKNNLEGKLFERCLSFGMKEEKTLQRQIFGDNPSNEATLIFTITGIMSLILYWHKDGYKKSEDEMADCLVRLLTAPIMNPDIDI